MDVGRGELRARGDEAVAHGLGVDAIGVEAGAVVDDLDDDVAALVRGAQAQRRLGRLAGGGAALRRLDAVVDAVADHVHQRVVDVLDDLAIELGLLALQHQLDVLAGLLAQVADQAGHLLEDLPDRHHAHRHRVALQVAGDALQLGHAAAEALVDRLGEGRVGGEDRLGDDQLADHVDQVVQFAGVDLDRALRLDATRRRRGGRTGGSGRGRSRRGVGPVAPGARPACRPGRRPPAYRAAAAGNHRLDREHQRVAARRHRRGAAGRDAIRQLLHHDRQQVDGAQDDVELVRAHQVLAGAGEVEQALDAVRQLLHRGDAERAGVALDRVERPEDVVEQLDVGGRAFELQDDALDGAEMIEGLAHEHVQHLGIGGENRQLVVRCACRFHDQCLVTRRIASGRRRLRTSGRRARLRRGARSRGPAGS